MIRDSNVIELARLTTKPYACPYLPGRMASLTYRILIDISTRDYEALLCRGWRRFGCEFFRPVCPSCTACRSLRVNLQDFTPSRSQCRTLARHADVDVIVQQPTVTLDHIRLYNAYHEDMHRRKGWPRQRHTPDTYYKHFLLGDWPFAREFLYVAQGRLVGVALADVTPNALSAIYFYHDPARRQMAPGVYSILQQIAYGRRAGLQHLYLGYCITESASMAYKAHYRPHEILAAYPADTEQPIWQAPEGAVAEPAARLSTGQKEYAQHDEGGAEGNPPIQRFDAVQKDVRQ
jgi:arginyl-tRNA--protein-N-Asp/Glu arginylyltransferase